MNNPVIIAIIYIAAMWMIVIL